MAGEEVKSGMGKGIVGIWLFMALILNSSYTAHLASILTVDKLEATIEDMNSLSRSNVKIGHMNGSFVKDYLISELNISEERLIPLGNPNEYLEKLISEEVGAIVEETPYVQIIRAQYPCAKFAIVDRGYFDTGGLGFFFRKGSPFLGDISRAVLNISERHHTIESIRSQWFGQQSSCPDLESGVQSNTNPIAPANLWILFVFTASVYAITAFIHIGRKLQQRRQRRGR